MVVHSKIISVFIEKIFYPNLSIFSLNNKIKILTIENKLIPVYIEIIEALNELKEDLD